MPDVQHQDGTEQKASTRRKRIILHCGAPKTGSTALQHFFADNRKALMKDGALNPGRFISRGDVDPLHRTFVTMRRGNQAQTEEAIAQGRERLAHLLAEPGVDTLLISNESLLGEPFLAGEAAFFPQYKKALAALGQLFEGYDVQVVFFIRSFEAFIPSYYVQDIRRGATWSFGDFCANKHLSTLSWQPLIAALGATFGLGNVCVHTHEALVAEPEQTVRSAFGGFFPHLPAFRGGQYGKNRSVGVGVLACYRAMNWLFLRLVPKRRQSSGRRLMRRLLFVPLANITGYFGWGRKVRAPEELAECWRDQYQQDQAVFYPKTSGNSE